MSPSDWTMIPDASWGMVPYTGGEGTNQRSGSAIVPFNAGTTQIRPQAYRTGSGTSQVNYPVCQALPLRFS